MKIVSACLAGVKCRWDGEARPCKKVIELVRNGGAIPICPEQLGGLETPRIPAERVNTRVLRKNGQDVTEQFVKGAREALHIAVTAGCKEAILKANSPSCGFGKTYDGTFSGTLTEKDGVTGELFRKNGITVITEEDL
ncbi:MAG: DUF523 domain-containing protein [Candidatus Moranbacteria bacterium]|nr:DUF523 domain-containing protein [Candidatus Moranbacteria bacterium]